MKNVTLALFALALLCTGCSNNPTWFGPNDRNMRGQTLTQLAADAVKRFPFQADAPSGGVAVGRAEVNYGIDSINIVNLSDEEWTNVELWVNREYVVLIPKIIPRYHESVNFEYLFNDHGKSFPVKNRGDDIQKLEMLRNGKLYTIPLFLAE